MRKPPHSTKVNECSKRPKKGVQKTRRTAPGQHPRKPSENHPYRAKPEGKGGSKTFGNY